MEWIACKDKMPSGYLTVLLYACRPVAGYGPGEQFTGWLSDGAWIFNAAVNPESAFPLESISHWMPIPEAPK